MANSEIMPASLQDNILALYAFSDDHAALIRNVVTVSYFESSIYRDLVSRIENFYDRYNKAPKEHLGDLVEDILEGKDRRKAELVSDILTTIYDYKDKVNAEFVINQLSTFVRRQKLKIGVAKAHELILQSESQGDLHKLDEAESALEESRASALTLFDPGTFIGDTKRSLRFLEPQDNNYFSLGIPEFDRRGICPARKELFLFMGLAKKGKAQPLYSKILTPFGWKTMGDMFPGQTIIGQDGLSYEVTSVHPQGKQDVYEVAFKDGGRVRCSGEHLWTLRYHSSRYWWGYKKLARDFTTQEVVEKIYELDTKGKPAWRFYTPLPKNPIHFSETSPLPVNPYFLGLLLGDGGFSSNDVGITSEDGEIVQAVKENSSLLGLEVRPRKGDPLGYAIVQPKRGIPNHPLLNWLRKWGLLGKTSWTKFIPDEYLHASSPDDRLSLLQGLLDTDGTIGNVLDDNPTALIEFDTASLTLASQVRELVLSLGGIAKQRPNKSTCYYKGRKITRVYQHLSIFLPETVVPFRLSRKLELYRSRIKTPVGREIVSIEKVAHEEVQCITTNAPGGLYVTDDYILTHNSWFGIHVGKQAVIHHRRMLHITLEMREDLVSQRYMQAMFTIGKRRETVKLPSFERDELGRMTSFTYDELERPAFEDPNIRSYLTQRINPRTQLIVKEFPTGSLTVPQLKAYLSALENRHNFIPDIIFLDYPDLMQLDANILRVDTGRIIKELRGVASERNCAMICPTQGNRSGESVQTLTGSHTAEDFSKIHTADVVVTYNQSEAEKRLGFARLFADRVRNDESGFAVLIAQNYGVGQFCLDSVAMNSIAWRIIKDENDRGRQERGQAEATQ